ncbi:MAG: hypothetical protein GIX03_00190 [Candidatus Eremiobacteraeota bacterium]|nr:hypothetical protein [Candidatus Eremiobacteraeota bacterium]MBC5801442.1 hypothetical protein [Candidatus Eremiobacteraeota bacterium]MBC5821192.1 hypothetical protein [Candidatus Eremiobacteraeota bacterium]
MSRPDLAVVADEPYPGAVTLLEELERRHPGDYGPNAMSTLQRLLRHWRANDEREREVFFAQGTSTRL